jgi:KaiC/GvpD/RAD55 family RecA-like ATPase
MRESFIDQYMDKKGKKRDEPIDFKPISISELTGTDFGEYKYLVSNLIPREGITLISASPKSGKSWLILLIMIQIAKGEPVFELETIKSKILVVDEENTARGLKRRIGKLTDDELANIIFLNRNGFKIDRDSHRKWLKDYITQNSIEVVVFDSFRRIHDQEENTSDGISKVYDHLKDLMSTGVAVILIDHNRKLGQFEKISMESIRGSSDKYAGAEAIIMLQTKDLESAVNGKTKKTVVMPELRESADLTNFAVEWYDSEDGTKVIFDYKGPVSEEQSKKDKAVELLMEIFNDTNGKETVKGLYQKLKPEGIGEKTIRDGLKELTVNNFLLETSGTGKQWNTKFYSKPNELLGGGLYTYAKLPSNSDESKASESALDFPP